MFAYIEIIYSKINLLSLPRKKTTMQQLKQWLQTTPYKEYRLTVASADASFRKYYRLQTNNESVLVMDASLEKESLGPFLDITQRLLSVGVQAPQILLQNTQLGYLVIEDFGSVDLLSTLTHNNFQTLYKQAINVITTMQHADISHLPLYDKAFLLQEMGLMQTWYLEKKLTLTLTNTQHAMVQNTLNTIADVVLQQPQNCFVHRDFHSRNIMVKEDGGFGIIDYQDAMNGSITYDLVSLLKDCYISFEPKAIEELALYFYEQNGINSSKEEFLMWFDFTGMQRHIKVLGIFSRLSLRDNKHGYLQDIPLTRNYLIQTAKKYPQTQPLATFLEENTQ